MKRPFLGECISLWDALKVKKVSSKPSNEGGWVRHCRCSVKS
jgi:hypothetical protein